MKRIFFQVLFLGLIISLFSSCSWISSRRSVFGGSEEDSQELKTVPKAQYDDLLAKYKNLLDANKLEKANGKDQKKLISDIENKSLYDASLLVDKLDKIPSVQGELAETVEVFGKTTPTNSQNSATISGTEIESQIKNLRKASQLLEQNKYDDTLRILKVLENSKISQVRVRAKFLTGELLFRQGEYDLSMQIFEEILQKDAFSSIILKSLGRLVVCSEKLKLRKKQDSYYSLLHDFFESE